MAQTTKLVVSPRFTIIRNDIESLLIGLVITSAGAGLTYLAEYLSKLDWGEFSVVAVPLFAFLINIIRKYLSKNLYVKRMFVLK